jgi:hypothetical protein
MPYGMGKRSKNLVRGRNRPKTPISMNGWIQFYNLVKPNFKDHTRRLARWLGVVSKRVGPDMIYRLVTESGSKIISQAISVGHVNREDYLQADRRKEVQDFNCRIEASLDDANFIDDGEDELGRQLILTKH